MRENRREAKDPNEDGVRHPDQDGDAEDGEQAEREPIPALPLAREEREDDDDETR